MLNGQQRKARATQVYEHFWTSSWKSGRSAGIWAIAFDQCPHEKRRIFNAVIKLNLEGKITDEESVNLRKMLRSPDKENVYVAISVMEAVAPERFRNKRNQATQKKPGE